MLKLRFAWGVVVAVLLCATLSLSQATLGVIAGTVTDASGAVVAGADVSVQRTEGGEKTRDHLWPER